MQLQIFDVEHGACALLTYDNGTRFMVDCGHNTTTGRKPGTYLRQQRLDSLEMLAITNYDEDHVSGIIDLFDNIEVYWLLRNRDVSGAEIRSLKSEDGMGAGIEYLVDTIEYAVTGDESTEPFPVFSGLEWQAFWNSPLVFDDENNLSCVVHLKCHGIGVMFPGGS